MPRPKCLLPSAPWRSGPPLRRPSGPGQASARIVERDWTLILATGRPPEPIAQSFETNPRAHSDTRLPRRARALGLTAVVLAAGVAVAVGACGGGSSKPVPRTHPSDAADSRRSSRRSPSCSPARDRRSTRSSGSASTMSRCSCRGGRWPRTPLSHTRPPGSTPPTPAAYAAAVWAPFDAIVRAAASAGSASTSRSRPPRRCGRPGRASRRAPPRLRRVLGALGEGVRAVREGRGDAVRRPLHAGGRERSAPARALLVDLERTELRPAAGPTGGRQLDCRGLAVLVPGAARCRLDRARPDRARRRQDPDRRGRAPRGDDWRSTGELLRDGAVALHPRALLRRRLAAPAAGDRRDTARLPGDRGGIEGVPERASGAVPRHRIRGPSLSAGSGHAEHRNPERARLRRPPKLPSLEATLDGADGRVRVEHRNSRSTTPSSATRRTRPKRSRARSTRRWPPTT